MAIAKTIAATNFWTANRTQSIARVRRFAMESAICASLKQKQVENLVSTCLDLTISEQSGDVTHLRQRQVRLFRFDPALRP